MAPPQQSQDYEDMNATPLGKLPMPKMQSKMDAPRVDINSASYADILKGLETDKQMATSVGPGGGAPGGVDMMAVMGGQQHQVQPPPMYQPQQQQQMMMPDPYQGAQQYQEQQYYQQPPPVYRRERERRRTSSRGGSKRGRQQPAAPTQQPAAAPAPPANGFMARLRPYRTPILVTLIVFAVLRWIVPRLSMLPRMSTSAPCYPLSLIGVALVAVLCGGLYRATEYLAPPS